MHLPPFRQYQSLFATGSFYLAVSLVCTQVPLLNYLGFEFSVLIALLASVLSGIRTITMVRRVYRVGEERTEDPGRVFSSLSRTFLTNLSFLLIPLVVLSGNAFFVKNCSYLEGVAFFMLLPVVSVWFSTCFGLFCAVHYRFARTIFWLLFLSSFAYAIALGYFTPAIFSYNFFYGYFPGFSYDEILRISTPLLLFRLLTAFLGVLLLWLGWLIIENTAPRDPAWKKGIRLLEVLVRPGHRTITASIILCISLIHLFRCDLGFESTAIFIQKSLGGSSHSEHFVIYYSPQAISDDEIRRVTAEHEFRRSQILEAFVLRQYPVITSYVYPDAETKRRLIGTGTTNLAKPWSDEIHLTQQSVNATLKHELVHVVAGRFGIPVLRASLSTGLVEGLAMALEWDWGHRTLHQYAAAMRKFGVAPEIGSLMSPAGFASQSSAISYVLAGSFCRYLIDRYGIRPIAVLYRSGDYREVYGRSLKGLIIDWSAFLDEIPVKECDRDAVDFLFRQPPIFRKVCARVLARRNEEARKEMAAKDYAGARSLYEESYRDAGGYEALSGLLASAMRAGDYSSVVAALDTIIEKDPRPARFSPLLITSGDALWALGNIGRAAGLYQKVREGDIAESLTEATIIRLAAQRDSTHAQGFLRYFLAEAPDSLRLVLLDSLAARGADARLTGYLRGRILTRLSRSKEAVLTLESLECRTLAPEAEALRLKMLGRAYAHLGRYDQARASFWLSLNAVSTPVAQVEVNDWIDRCEWMMKHGL